MYPTQRQANEPGRPASATNVRAHRYSRTMLGVATVNAADPVSDREYVPHGAYGTEADALAAAEHLIDEQLEAAIATGCSAERAFQEWTEFGEIPLIIAIGADAHAVDFDPFSYAVACAQRFSTDAQQPQGAVTHGEPA